MTYTSWGTNEPNYGDQNEACAHFMAGLDYKWNDYICTEALCYICEIDMS